MAGGTRAWSRKLPPVRTLVVLPTYNEAENVEPMLRALTRVFDRHGIGRASCRERV